VHLHRDVWEAIVPELVFGQEIRLEPV
jgi:hypothetical protein